MLYRDSWAEVPIGGDFRLSEWPHRGGGSGSVSGWNLCYISVHNGTDANLHRVHHRIEVLA
jgi:hypothetical protein